MNDTVNSKYQFMCDLHIIFKNKLPYDNGISYREMFTAHSKYRSMLVQLFLLVKIIQCLVKIGLVTETFIANYQSLFFKLTQFA